MFLIIFQVHYKMRNHKCHTCNKAFGQAATLQTHINNVHLQIKKYKCQECAKCFKNTTALKYHIKTKHEGIREVHKCKQCPKQFTHSQTLRYHVNFSHKGIRKFQCDECQKYFPSPGYVKTHKNTRRRIKRRISNAHFVPKNFLQTIS